MNIRPELVASLQSRLINIDALRSDHEKLGARIGQAQAAAARLREQISALDTEAKKAADVVIPAAADRLSQIIAGSSVAQPDTKSVEAAATTVRHIGARRQQCAEDLAAVQAHIASLSSSAARIEADITAGEGAFLAALADAALDAYKRDALAFVSQHVPQLHSIVRRLWKQTGKGPEWELTVFSGLKILWYEDVLKKASAHHQAERELVVLWPRGDQALVSGAPIISDELVDGLITEIRSAAAKEIA